METACALSEPVSANPNLDRLLVDRRLLAPIEQVWAQTARGHGRPTIPMGSFVRLMVLKQRTGWGYKDAGPEVSDSLHLRRFCLLPLTQRVPDESTVRKLVRRLGPRSRRAHPGGRRGMRKYIIMASRAAERHPPSSWPNTSIWNTSASATSSAGTSSTTPSWAPRSGAAWPPASWSTTTWSARWSTGA